jgi:hypothetical protein
MNAMVGIPQHHINMPRPYAYTLVTASGLKRFWTEVSEAGSASKKIPFVRTFPGNADDSKPARVKLTERAVQHLGSWREAGLLGHTAHRNEVLDQVTAEKMSYLDAARELAGPQLGDLSMNFARQIDDLCVRWQGASRHESMQAVAAEQAKPPRFAGLPAWLDPDEVLDADHPLRAIRERMEAQLFLENPTWHAMSNTQRGHKRLQWLGERREVLEPDGGALLNAALSPEGRFSALRYWLTGLED